MPFDPNKLLAIFEPDEPARVPEPTEFERRFLVLAGSTLAGADSITRKITDLYVEPSSEGSPPLRLRTIRELGAMSAIGVCEATVKTGSNSTERPEHTYAIPHEAVDAWESSIPRERVYKINKRRASWIENGAKMHVETVFLVRHAGPSLDIPGIRNENSRRAAQRAMSERWAIGEAEFPTKAEKDAFRPPEGWIEVSGIKAFSNYNLARYGWPSLADFPFLAGPDPETGSPQSNTL